MKNSKETVRKLVNYLYNPEKDIWISFYNRISSILRHTSGAGGQELAGGAFDEDGSWD